MTMTLNVTENAITPLLVEAAANGITGRTHTPGVVDRTFQAIMTGTANIVVEATNDPTFGVWFTIFSTSTNGAGSTSAIPYKYIRARVNSYTSGLVSMYMGT